MPLLLRCSNTYLEKKVISLAFSCCFSGHAVWGMDAFLHVKLRRALSPSLLILIESYEGSVHWMWRTPMRVYQYAMLLCCGSKSVASPTLCNLETLLELAFKWTTFLSNSDRFVESLDYRAQQSSCSGQIYTVQVIMYEMIKQQARFKT